MHTPVLVVVVALAVVCEAAKISPAMEKCGEQMLMTLAKEQNKGLKTKMNKVIKQVQGGDQKGAQQTAKTMTPDEVAGANERFWVADCALMRGCLECPIEL